MDLYSKYVQPFRMDDEEEEDEPKEKRKQNGNGNADQKAGKVFL